MIKKLTLSAFILLLFVCTKSFAQATVQSSNLPNVGDIWAYKTITDTTIQPGLTGSGVTWNYSSYYITPTVYNFNHLAVGTSGDDASFPTANIKISSSFGGYEYYYKSASGMQFLGYKSSNLELYITNVQNLLTVPLTYGETISNQAVTGTSVSGFPVSGTISATADGTGTLLLSAAPASTPNLLRVHYDINLVVAAGSGLDTYVHLERYCWYKTGLRAPLFIIESLNISGALANSSQKSVFVNTVTATAVDELSAGLSLSIFPNPSPGKITVSINAIKAVNGSYSIMDLTGRIWKKETLNVSAISSVAIDLATLPKGIYIFSLQNGSAVKQQRFVVE